MHITICASIAFNGFGQVDLSHPALEQAQPGHNNGGWADVKVFYAAVVDPAQARVAARLSDGTAPLLDKTIERDAYCC